MKLNSKMKEKIKRNLNFFIPNKIVVEDKNFEIIEIKKINK